MGLRYRVQYRLVKGSLRSADIAFTKSRVAVFVDGCFWHQCPDHATRPATNADWWATKLDRNVERDAETTAVFQAAGWTVLRFWEHEDPAQAAELVARAVGDKQQ